MNQARIWSNLVVGLGTLMVGFATPHLIDDFLYGMPGDFGLTNPQAQILGGIFLAVLVVVLAAAARGHRVAYVGTLFFGAFLAAAAATKHLKRVIAESYWGGLPSEVFIIGLILSGLALAVVSLLALRFSPVARSEEQSR